MPGKPKSAFVIYYWAVVVAAFIATTVMLFVYTPTEEVMGPIQKMFYVHMPAAINTLLACLLACVGGVGYLWQRRMKWDDVSAAAAKVAALMCTVVLVTGVIWSRVSWGTWWDWRSPRLTFTLLLWLLYVVYIIIRPSIESPTRRATVCAVYAVAAFLDVPLVYLSARLITDDRHPGSVEITTAMKLTLAAWFVPVTLLTAGLIVFVAGRARRRRQQESQAVPETSWSPAATGAADASDDAAQDKSDDTSAGK